MRIKQQGKRVELHSPTQMPRASAYLWNKKMLVNVNCRGYVVAQFMQADVSKYSYAPNIEAKTFMQPEHSYYAHHPGRFAYIKDEDSGEIFSLPYEPVRQPADSFVFSAGVDNITWQAIYDGIECTLTLQVPVDEVVEMWSLDIRNTGDKKRTLSIYPYFTVGYMSWMNQSAAYNTRLGGIVASCVTPYQKLDDYPKIKTLKDKTFLLHDRQPDAWETNREEFEGEGGLHNPSALQQEFLSNSHAFYETPAAVLQYRVELVPGEAQRYRFVFGPAENDEEIENVRDRYFRPGAFENHQQEYSEYQRQGKGVIQSHSPDEHLDNFVNRWLARQIYYHGDINRLSNDPQTRNYLQDGLGMTYVRPQTTRDVFLLALSQQEKTGAMPDGILLRQDAQLQYINQIPHTDHCLWLPVCLKAYLDETDDYALLNESVCGHVDNLEKTVFDRITAAVFFLLDNRDHRGLSYIAQGDWCDPMNMVGPKGKGVSGWLSIATIYALKIWAEVCEKNAQPSVARELLEQAQSLSDTVNQYLWDGNWFARGITDDGKCFGVSTDEEGKIYLNPQSWSIMAGCVTQEQRLKIIEAVESHLETPFGVAMLAPAYTNMREDIGRVTQKYPGSAENGSIYNHAMIFYVFALYLCGESDRAFTLLRQMLPGPNEEDYMRRGQLPIFIPNYYRGAYHQNPDVAGRSSHLFNTGTVAWYYRCLVEGLYGLKGCREGLLVEPQFPSHWREAKVTRYFRGAIFHVHYTANHDYDALVVTLDGEKIEGNIVKGFHENHEYNLSVGLPYR